MENGTAANGGNASPADEGTPAAEGNGKKNKKMPAKKGGSKKRKLNENEDDTKEKPVKEEEDEEVGPDNSVASNVLLTTSGLRHCASVQKRPSSRQMGVCCCAQHLSVLRRPCSLQTAGSSRRSGGRVMRPPAEERR